MVDVPLSASTDGIFTLTFSKWHWYLNSHATVVVAAAGAVVLLEPHPTDLHTQYLGDNQLPRPYILALLTHLEVKTGWQNKFSGIHIFSS